MKKKNLVYTHGSGGCIKKKKNVHLMRRACKKKKNAHFLFFFNRMTRRAIKGPMTINSYRSYYYQVGLKRNGVVKNR